MGDRLLPTWPDEVVRRATLRDLIVFVGAGVSQSCVVESGEHPPSWVSLLKTVAERAVSSVKQAEISILCDEGRLLDAAELLRAETERTGRSQDVLSLIRQLVDGAPGKSYRGSVWHESIVRLEPQIIVTTNYDKIIERATNNGYNNHDYRSTRIAGDLRRKEPILLKMHGSVDKIEEVILTRRDYTMLRNQGRTALEVLQALMMTRVALFVGYGMRDPDIQLIMENVLGGREEAAPHYALMDEATPEYERDVLRTCYGINVISYPTGDYSAAASMLASLANEVEANNPLYEMSS
jgi:hypothetical protein